MTYTDTSLNYPVVVSTKDYEPLDRACGDQLSVLTDSERSPAIYRRVWLKSERLVA